MGPHGKPLCQSEGGLGWGEQIREVLFLSNPRSLKTVPTQESRDGMTPRDAWCQRKEPHGVPWLGMGPHGLEWGRREPPPVRWLLVGPIAFQGSTHVAPGASRFLLGLPGSPLVPHGTPWVPLFPMGPLGTPGPDWVPHGTLWAGPPGSPASPGCPMGPPGPPGSP